MRRLRIALGVLLVTVATGAPVSVNASHDTPGSPSTTLVRRYYETLNTGDFDSLTTLLAADFTVHTAAADEEPGIDGLIVGLNEVRAGLLDVTITVDNLVAEGNTVVARTTIRGTHGGELFGVPPTGKTIQTEAIDLWHVEGGRLTDNWHLEDVLALMRQVGAIPGDGPAAPVAAAGPAPVDASETGVADAATLAANKALVRRFDAEIIEGGNLAVADEILAADFFWHYELPAGTPPGPEGVKAFARDVRAAFADVRYEVEEIIAQGNRVAVHSIVTGTHRGEYYGVPASGRRVTIRILDIYRIADGKLAELWTVSDDLGFLTQVGALPAGGSPAGTPIRRGKVVLSGENPWIFLRDTPDGDARTQVSFWRIHWSPVGPGHVCYVTVGDGKTPSSVRIALYDNRRLLDYLTREVLGTYNKAYLERPFTPIGGATFNAAGDGVTERSETCKSDTYTIEMIWRDLRAASLIHIPPGSRPTNPFGITYLRIPAGDAEVRINGKPAPGKSVPEDSFVALGETWIQ